MTNQRLRNIHTLPEGTPNAFTLVVTGGLADNRANTEFQVHGSSCSHLARLDRDGANGWSISAASAKEAVIQEAAEFQAQDQGWDVGDFKIMPCARKVTRTEKPAAKVQAKKVSSPKAADLGAALVQARDVEKQSWAKVAVACGLPNPSAARKAYSRLVRPHTQSTI